MYSLRIGFPNWKRWMHDIPTPRSGSWPDEGACFRAEGVGSPSSYQAKAPTKRPFGTNTLCFSLQNLARFEFIYRFKAEWVTCWPLIAQWSWWDGQDSHSLDAGCHYVFQCLKMKGSTFCQKEGADMKLERLTLIFLSLKGIMWTQTKPCFLWSESIFDHPFSQSAGTMISNWVNDFKHWNSPGVCVHVRVYVHG